MSDIVLAATPPCLLARANALTMPLRDESVDLIVTSPPYFGQRAYKDGGETYGGQLGAEAHPRDFLSALWRVTAECWRVLKPTGVMFVNLGDKRSGSGGPGTTSGFAGRGEDGPSARPQGVRTGMTETAKRRNDTHAPSDRPSERVVAQQYGQEAFGRPKSKQLLPHRYAIGCEDGLADPEGIGWIVRQDMVWSKPNGMPESVTDRTRDNHEYWFMLCKQGDYFSNIDEIRSEPKWARVPDAAWAETREATADRRGAGHRNGKSGGFMNPANPLGVLPSSVWEIPTQPLTAPDHLGIEHFAAFPMEWPRRLILAFSPPDGVVLDPMGGTGTTAMVARALGRTGISFDLSRDYLRLARWRVYESGHNAKIESRTNGDRQGVLL